MDVKYYYVQYSIINKSVDEVAQQYDYVIDINPIEWLIDQNEFYKLKMIYMLHYSREISKEQYDRYEKLWNE